MTIYRVLIILFTLLSYDLSAMHFSKAKSILSKKVYGSKGKTFYCGCNYQVKSIDHSSCEVKSKKQKKRRKRMEWEHVVPAHAFGRSFRSWRDHKKICGKKSKSPRKCARKKDSLFKEMEGDPHNLVPAVGSVNAMRSNYSFAEVRDGKELCSDFFLKDRKVMPPSSVKGDVARIYFYMDKKYPGKGIISNKNQKLFKAWSKLDPVDKVECERYYSIKAASKIENLVLKENCSQ